MNASIYKNRNTWPLWQCLEPQVLAKLVAFQWKHYRTKLDLLTGPRANIHIDTQIESLEEIDRLMRTPPEHPKRVV